MKCQHQVVVAFVVFVLTLNHVQGENISLSPSTQDIGKFVFINKCPGIPQVNHLWTFNSDDE